MRKILDAYNKKQKRCRIAMWIQTTALCVIVFSLVYGLWALRESKKTNN